MLASAALPALPESTWSGVLAPYAVVVPYSK